MPDRDAVVAMLQVRRYQQSMGALAVGVDARMHAQQDKYQQSELAEAAKVHSEVTPPPIMGDFSTGTPTGWWNQFAVVFRRSFFYKLREPAAVMTQFFNSVFLSIIIGCIYWQMNSGQAAAMVRSLAA